MSEGAAAQTTIFGVPRRIAAGFALAIAALGFSAAFAFSALSARSQDSALTLHAAQCELAAEDVEAALLDADAALARHLEGDDPRLLGRYGDARALIEPALDELASVVRGHPGEEAQLDAVRNAVSRVVEEHAAALAAAAPGDRAGARARPGADTGTSALAAANAALQQLETEVMRAAVDGSARRARTIGLSTAIFVVAELLLLALIVGGARTVRAEIRAREGAMHVQQRLMGIVSHDLRNPLSAVLGSAWSLARADLPPDAGRAVQRIASSARRMHRLIRDVLDWSRAHAGAEIPVAPRDTDVYELCARVAEDLDRPAGERIRLTCDGDTRARIDPDRIEQVIANLLSNALRYAPPDRPVRVRVAGRGGDVRIEVSDDGPGIPPDVQAGLFEPFRTAPPGDASAGAGVGLGLFIVRTLAEAHGGSVTVRSAPGEGTTFVVQVPRGTVRDAGADGGARLPAS